jgi:His/Glu/Gln/Arg/opine family amino acid ABC transporter permease subunit
MDFARSFNESWFLLLQGLGVTVVISLISIFFGTIIGFFSSLLSVSRLKILRLIAGAYVWVIRGTPMIVQAFIVYFGMPQFIQLMDPRFRIQVEMAAIITLSLNAGAYLSEIFRGGIAAVDKGQVEAARSLGLSSSRTMYRIILPQAIKIAIPSMVNQFIITVKDTSILSVIGLADLVNKAKVYVGRSYQFFATYIFVAIYYLVVISVLMVISKYVEKKLNYERKDYR